MYLIEYKFFPAYRKGQEFVRLKQSLQEDADE